MITYAAGIWGSAVKLDSMKRVLRSFQRTFAIRAIRGFHTVSAVSAIALATFTSLHLKVKEVLLIENVKWSRLHADLPDDVLLEKRVKPGTLLHPAKRIAITFLTAKTQEEDSSSSQNDPSQNFVGPRNVYNNVRLGKSPH